MELYFQVWMITVIGFTLGIPDTVMGLTFIAAGVSVPDALSGIAVVREGQRDKLRGVFSIYDSHYNTTIPEM
jgi:Ca2+/Na+ antiporter